MSKAAARRIMQEAKELRNATDQYHAAPLEDNIFEWHFTIAGPKDTEFEGGRYHGRILLPHDYPMKPPNIILLTPNGRFEVNQKICLTISAHHPEAWQPSWSIRTMLMAIQSFLVTPGGGAIGALDYTPEERKKLAKRSFNWRCPTCEAHMSNVLASEPTTSELSDADREAMKQMQEIGFSAPRSRTATESSDASPRKRTMTETSMPGSSIPESTEGDAKDQVSEPNQAENLHAPRSRTTLEPSQEHELDASPTKAVPKSKKNPARTRVAVAQQQRGGWSFMAALVGVILAISFLLYRKYNRLE